MKPTIVRLPDFDRNDEHVYQLNWLGKVRRRGHRFEIFTRFVPEDTRRGRSRPYDCWVRLTDIPFLIADSRWYRGVMVRKPTNVREIRLWDTRIIKIHSLSMKPKEGALCFGSAYPIAFDRPASPVAEFEDEDGSRLFVPTTEIYRSHYFGIPRAQAGILHGLHRGGIANPSFEAWDPTLTSWTREEFGIARIAPARFLQTHQVAYVARILFSEPGRQTLDKLQDWVLKFFTQAEGAHQALPAKLLPIPKLPYPKATWEASIVALPPDQDGRECLLVTHIESFDAPEPYLELERVEPRAPRTTDEEAIGPGGSGRGEVLDPITHDSVDSIDDGWDPALEPIAVANVITIDKAARRRLPTRIVRDPTASMGGSTRLVHSKVETRTASTQAYGPYSSGVAPLLFADVDPWPNRDESMDVAYEAIRRAAMQAVTMHLKMGISAEVRFLPDDRHAYAFEIRRAASSRSRSGTRQFVIAHVRLGSKHVVIIEPQRRSKAEKIPLGIAWRVGEHAYGSIDLDGIRHIVRHMEDVVSERRSWIRLNGLVSQFKAVAVWHPAASITQEKAIATLSERILARLLEAIGDLRI